jgi:hypothetical protein
MYRGSPRSLTSRRRTTACAMLMATAIGSGFFATGASAAPKASPACTITGTAGNDTLRGTPGADVICGLGGNDVITGAGGNDLLYGGAGNDQIDGGAGNDLLDGGAGNDRIIGAAGNDGITAGGGKDTIDGGAGNDQIDGGDGSDITNGGAGNDQIDGGAGNDALAGGTGNDTLKGGEGTDAVNTGGGTDTCASDAADRVTGACTTDRTGPVITWIDAPTTVTAGTAFSAEFSVADASGIDPQSVAAFLGGASGWVTSWCGFPIMPTQISGTSTDSTWSISCSVPAQAVSSTYSLFLSAQDFFANSGSTSPRSTGNGYFAVVGGNSDDRAPAISSVVVPATATPGSPLTFTWQATDTTGVAYATVWVYGPNGPKDASGAPVVDYGSTYGTRVSGTDTDGGWSQTVTVPANAVEGTYSVRISTADTLGNKTFAQYSTFTIG